MNANANDAPNATPREIAREITRAWFGYFIVVTIVGAVLSVLVGGIYGAVANAVGGNAVAVRLAIIAISIVINAPISFLVFQWAVRSKVVPAILAWRAGAAMEAA